MDKNGLLAIIVGIVLISTTAFGCATFYYYNQTQAMKSNIDVAISKGIDPVAVRCAYGSSDQICLAYAITHGKSSSEVKK